MIVARLATCYAAIDAADHLLTRPDGAVLLYPVVSMSGNTSGGTRTALIGPDPSPQQIAAWSIEVNQTAPDSCGRREYE
ncbi:hypothetical protein [Sphingomonas sp.]|uniref:hypothetical protein n=1 Tax=Sphingomonas sp. TaxID=28214 RepID=UPI003D6C8260